MAPPTDIERTISYPVKWSDETKRFMIETAAKAGFPNVEGMDEAQAAIHAVLVQNEAHLKKNGLLHDGESATILLVDMGAGTTDLVLCRYTPGIGNMELLNTWPQGDKVLFGGQEVDRLLQDFFRSMLTKEDADALFRRVGTDKFKEWKDKLVSPTLLHNEVVNSFEALDTCLDLMGAELEEYELDRETFEHCLSDYLPELPTLIRDCIQNAGMQEQDIDLVIVTGGHSQWYFVRDILLGNMKQYGALDLDKIKDKPERVISMARPQETVALGLAFQRIPIRVLPKSAKTPSTEKEPTVQQEETKNKQIDELDGEPGKRTVLEPFPFGNINDRVFKQGPGWIELPIKLYGSNPVSVGQQFAFYYKDGTILCALPVASLMYNGQSVQEVTENDIPFRAKFSVKDSLIEEQQKYENVEWLISTPGASREIFSRELYRFAKRTLWYPADEFPGIENELSESFLVQVNKVCNSTVYCDFLGSELDANKALYIYKKTGNAGQFHWKEVTVSFRDCVIEMNGYNDIAVGDIICDYVLPDGFTVKREIDPNISWVNHINVIPNSCANTVNIPSVPAPVHSQSISWSHLIQKKLREHNIVKGEGAFRENSLDNLRRYLQVPRTEKVLLAHDDTLFKSGKNGFVFTEKGVYCRGYFESPTFTEWDEVVHSDYRVGSPYIRLKNGRIIIYMSGLKEYRLHVYDCLMDLKSTVSKASQSFDLPPAIQVPEDAEEAFQLGQKLEDKKDFYGAFACYRKAAAKQHSGAQYHLGICYSTGIGVLVSPKEAWKWYRQSAVLGYAPAQAKVGFCYYSGDRAAGVSKNLEEAKHWLEQAAKQGNEEAEIILIRMLSGPS